MAETTNSREPNEAGVSNAGNELAVDTRQKVLNALNESASYDDATLDQLQVMRRQVVASATGVSSRDQSNFKLPVFELIWAKRAAFALVVTLGFATLIVLQGLERENANSSGALYADTDRQVDTTSVASSGLVPLSDAISESSVELTSDEEVLADEQLALFADDELALDFYESLAFYEWLESREV